MDCPPPRHAVPAACVERPSRRTLLTMSPELFHSKMAGDRSSLEAERAEGCVRTIRQEDAGDGGLGMGQVLGGLSL